MGNNNASIAEKISDQYKKYHFEQIVTNRFTHKSYVEELFTFESNTLFSFSIVGVSEEGRDIKSITFGNGKTKILLWSQMHGNESTATRAILDILNFLSSNDEFDSFREKIAKELTLTFIPMLNPDGTERFQRRTATEIDMNRDAVELQTPEGRILDKFIDKYKPQFGFNLHDQRRFYNVKGTAVPSSISFLAPAFNQAREINSSREKAMQVITGMNKILQAYIPGGVGLYDDTYSYRSFGDVIQAKGVSTILVESGWQSNDMEKEAIRKLNFTALLGAFDLIATNSFKNYSSQDYLQIPDIDTKLFDVLINNVKIGRESESIVDMGINRTEHLTNHPHYYSKGQLDDIGDLSVFYGFETINADGLTLVKGKTAIIENLEDISMVYVKRLLKQGVLFLVTTDIPFENQVPLPINIVHPRKLKEVQSISFEGFANFLLKDENEVIKYIIMNGFLMTLDSIGSSINGIVIT